MLSIPSATASHLPLKPTTTPPARADASAAEAAAAARAANGADGGAVQAPAGPDAPVRREFTPPASPLRDLQLPFSVGFGAGRTAAANLHAQQLAAAAAQAAAAREAAARSAYVVPPTSPGARLDTSA